MNEISSKPSMSSQLVYLFTSFVGILIIYIAAFEYAIIGMFSPKLMDIILSSTITAASKITIQTAYPYIVIAIRSCFIITLIVIIIAFLVVLIRKEGVSSLY